MKLRKFFLSVVCVVSLLFLFGFLFLLNAQDLQTQETHGEQSPAVNTESGDVIITYGSAIETIEALKEFIQSKEKDIDSLKQRLIEIHKSEFDSIPEDAERWATHFISTMPIRIDSLKTQKQSLDQERKDKRLESSKLQKKVEVLFNFLIDAIDSNLNELKKIGGIKEYEKFNYPYLFRENPNITPASRNIRKIAFNNSSAINIVLHTGALNNGLVMNCPNISFNVKYMNGSEERLFVIQEPQRGGRITLGIPPVIQDVEEPKIADVSYSIGEESIFSKQFKDEFKKSFDEAIGLVYYIDSQLDLNTSKKYEGDESF